MSTVGRRSAIDTIKLLPLGLLYAAYLALSFAVGLAVLLFQELFRDPCWCSRHDRHHRISPIAATMAVDAAWALIAYVLGDFLRCRLWLQTGWPETEPNYGPTIEVHLKMLACVVILWPLILYCLGWYKARWRPLHWRITRTIAALALLGLSMSAVSLLFARVIYPRAQFGFMIVMLPLITMLFGALRDLVVYLRRGRPANAASEF